MNNALNKLEEILSSCHLERNVPLSELTSFRIGGPAALVMRTQHIEEIQDAVQACRELEIPWHLLGNGTDILAPDSGFCGLVIRLYRERYEPIISDCRVKCHAGLSLNVLSRYSIERGFSGMEHLAGIPGTLGGAVAMNAGAFGTEIQDLLRQVTFLENGEIQTVTVQNGDLGYRYSRFHAPERIVLEAVLELTPDSGSAESEMEDCLARRNRKQPLDYPSAGSVFKRPEGAYAGSLIEQCGLKGERVGDAQVSMKHAGFIINLGHATEKDVMTLIERVQERVLRETGYRLEREIKLLSEA